MPHPRGRGMCARDLAIDLMTVPKSSKIVLSNVPNLRTAWRTQMLCQTHQMSQTLGQHGARKGFFRLIKCPKPQDSMAHAKVFFKFKKCPKPRGRGMCARDLAFGLMAMPKSSKNVLSNVPNLSTAWRTQRLF